MKRLSTSILTILAISGALYINAVEAGFGMGSGSSNRPDSGYGPGYGGGYGRGPGDRGGYGRGPADGSGSGFGMGNRGGREIGRAHV